MITQDEFLAVAAARPEMKLAFQAAVRATAALRIEAAKNKRGLFAGLNVKRLGVKAVFLTEDFISGFVYNGRPANEEEQEQIRDWVVVAAMHQIENSN